MKDLGDGWSLETWDSFKPMLSGPGDLSAEITPGGDVLICGVADFVGVVVAPIAALQALINAHAEWEQSQQSREAAKTESGGADVRTGEVNEAG